MNRNVGRFVIVFRVYEERRLYYTKLNCCWVSPLSDMKNMPENVNGMRKMSNRRFQAICKQDYYLFRYMN